MQLESDGLTCVYTKQQGEQLACGTSSGCIHLLNIPEYYTSTTKQEKNLVAAVSTLTYICFYLVFRNYVNYLISMAE